MSQLSLLLPDAPAARADAETGVRMAWALDHGRPVHISRFSHLRSVQARPALSCVGCATPVHPVLHGRGKGQPHRADHFRHGRQSADCWASFGAGALLWNALLHLHDVLAQLPPTERARLRLRHHCGTSRWSTEPPLFARQCAAHHDQTLPEFSRVGLSPTRPRTPKVPDLRFFSTAGVEVLRLRLRTARERSDPGPDPVRTLELELDERTHRLILAWDPARSPSDRLLPFTTERGSAWRCADHR